MRIKTTVHGLFFLSLLLFVFFLFFKFPLPRLPASEFGLVANFPIQKEIQIPPFHKSEKGFSYEITPLYSYDISGLIVEQYTSANWLDVTHKLDPGQTRDLCLEWGSNVTSGVYRDLTYSHREFTCYYNWDHQLNRPFDDSALSNNHLLPATPEVARAIGQAGIGDLVEITGYLSTYKVFKNGVEVGSRGTSTTRTDTGNGACETIYVTGIKILSDHNQLFQFAKQFLPLTVLFSLFLSLILSFFDLPYPKPKVHIY